MSTELKSFAWRTDLIDTSSTCFERWTLKKRLSPANETFQIRPRLSRKWVRCLRFFDGFRSRFPSGVCAFIFRCQDRFSELLKPLTVRDHIWVAIE